jgi:chemotaxis protein MotB
VREGDLPIRVEGFTDDRPIASDIFPSNWELSSARAASVVKLLADHGVAAERLAAIGYGEFQPKTANLTEEGRAANRRVVLMISRSARLRPQLAAQPAPIEVGTAAVPAAAAEVPQAAAAAPEAAAAAALPVVRVELQGGGILFTSDPERARVLQQRAAAADTEGEATQPAPPR